MPPPITSASTFFTRFMQQVDLGGNLGAADDRDDRAHRLAKALFQRLQFGLHGAAGIGRQVVGQAFGRGMGAVGGREGVVDENVAVGSQRCDKGRIVLFLALVEAGVFKTAGCRRPSSPRPQRPPFRRCSRRRKPTLRPMHVGTAAAIGSSDNRRSGPSFGRPKWASRMTFAPLSASSRMVGATRSMRVESVTLPSAIGTLRSTRTSTRLPVMSPIMVERLETAHRVCSMIMKPVEICAANIYARETQLPQGHIQRGCSAHCLSVVRPRQPRLDALSNSLRLRDRKTGMRGGGDRGSTDTPTSMMWPCSSRLAHDQLDRRRAAGGRHIRRGRRAAPS